MIKLRFLIERIILILYTGSVLLPPEDNLSSTFWWRLLVLYQTRITRSHEYEWVLFGDSISAHLGNPFSKSFFNFAIGGMSLVSLSEQLKLLRESNLKLKKAIVAMGTNDAWYGVSDAKFVSLMQEVITLLRLMGATHIVLLPAFYSTIAASLNPLQAASLKRVEEINALIEKVACLENVSLETENLATLYDNKVLKDRFTIDGVHLNQAGNRVYQEMIRRIISDRRP